jgi:hypothetical protein
MNTPSTVVSPGIGAFLAFFALAVALWLLMRNMNARMRRMSYRAEEAQRQAQAEGERRPTGEADGADGADTADAADGADTADGITPQADDEGPAEGQTGRTRP